MSRTDKDVPHRVWIARADDRTPFHFGCAQDTVRRYRCRRPLSIVQHTEVAWRQVEVAVDVPPDIFDWIDDLPQDCGWEPESYRNTRTQWRYEEVTTETVVRAPAVRDCDIDHPDSTRSHSCDWHSPSYNYKRGSSKTARRLYHHEVRAQTRARLRQFAADWNTDGESDVDVSTANLRFPWWN